MKRIFYKYINEQLQRLKGCNGEKLLSTQAFSAFEKRLTELSESISESTMNAFIKDYDTRQKLYHRNALSGKENNAKTSRLLSEIMHRNIRGEFAVVADSEIRQLERGDIPYVYTLADSRDLYSDGEKIAENVFEYSPVGHILNTLSAMSDKDEAFDTELLQRAAAQFPYKSDRTGAQETAAPVRTSGVLARKQALREAGKLFETLFDICIHSPAGKLFWGYVSDGDYSFGFCEHGLASGLLGIAVFAAAYAFAEENERAAELADKAVNESVIELDRMYDYFAYGN